ncbi:MAG: amidohydrolase family protein, partial [Acidobacteria bacterium]|nr:amidohydrolase family protein [Acidobacteriota bacterium]
EAVERVREWADANPDKAWVVGRGWTTFIGEEQATRQALDAAVPDRPVHLASEDGTAAWVNSRALKLARIVRRAKDPVGAGIVRDVRGEPTGVLEGAAVLRITSLLPKPSNADRTRAMFAALEEARRQGITSIQTSGLEPGDIDALDKARHGGSLETRVYAALAVRAPNRDDEIARLDPILERYPDDPMLKSGAADVDAASTDADGLNRLVRLLDARGWQVSIHEKSMEEGIRSATALSHAMRSNPTRELERRHRIEKHEDRFGQVGTRHVVGSGWPYGPLSPMRVLASFQEQMPLKDAIVGYTAASAYASLDEQRKGTLKPGMLADIVVLSRNIFKMERRELPSVTVSYTIFDGRVVYPVERKSTTTFP